MKETEGRSYQTAADYIDDLYRAYAQVYPLTWLPAIAFISKVDVPDHIWALQRSGDVIVSQAEDEFWGVWC